MKQQSFILPQGEYQHLLVSLPRGSLSGIKTTPLEEQHAVTPVQRGAARFLAWIGLSN